MRRISIGACSVFLTVLSSPPIIAQAPAPGSAPPAFEAASVKANKTTEGRRGLGMPADRLTATALTLHQLIAYAYGTVGPGMQLLLDEQIAGEQPWMTVDRFDINAKAGSDTPPGVAGLPQKLLMLRQLLTDRFKLAAHHETRTAPLYVLTIARADGKLGPELRSSDVDCQALAAARGTAPPPPPPSGATPQCGEILGFGGPSAQFRGNAEKMAQFALFLSRTTNRPVIDRTGLAGAFNIDIQFDVQGLEGVPTAPAPLGPPPDPPANPAPSLFTVLQDQLGLKLTSDRGPLDVLVIDHAEHPTEN